MEEWGRGKGGGTAHLKGGLSIWSGVEGTGPRALHLDSYLRWADPETSFGGSGGDRDVKHEGKDQRRLGTS